MDPKGESKYERLRKIGIGSYGVVFKCVNRQTGQIVAIKRYSENDSDPIIRKIAMREVRMLRQLKHPNLIHLIEVFRRKRRLHLVFDYCELTVLDVIEKYANNCPLNLIRKIIWQLVNGVSHCHSHNCIHRDIKPENILINQSGVVKLCDFGFARNVNPSIKMMSQSTNGNRQKQAEREAQLLGVTPNRVVQWKSSNGDNHLHNGNKENLVSTGQPIGGQDPTSRQALTEYVATRWYRAPELLVGEIYYDTKIDIWAIGCVTAELMRGEPLWPGKTDLDQLSMIKNSLGPLTPAQAHTLLTQNLYDQINTERLLSQSASHVGEPLERRLPARVGQLGVDFVLVCLQMDPAQRPDSDQLLQHSYIHSARMTQFVRGATPGQADPQGHTGTQNCQSTTTGSKGIGGQEQSSSLRTSNRSNTSSNSSLSSPPCAVNGSTLLTAIGGRNKRTATTNSQQILKAANNPPSTPSNKRLVLATDSPIAAIPKHNTFVSTVADRTAINNKNPAGMERDSNEPANRRRYYKRKLPPITSNGPSPTNATGQTVRAEGGMHRHLQSKGVHPQPNASRTEIRMAKKSPQQVGGELLGQPQSGSSLQPSPYRKLSQSNGNLCNGGSDIPKPTTPTGTNATMRQQNIKSYTDAKDFDGVKSNITADSRRSTKTRKPLEKLNSTAISSTLSPNSLESVQTSQTKSSSMSFLPSVTRH